MDECGGGKSHFLNSGLSYFKFCMADGLQAY